MHSTYPDHSGGENSLYSASMAAPIKGDGGVLPGRHDEKGMLRGYEESTLSSSTPLGTYTMDVGRVSIGILPDRSIGLHRLANLAGLYRENWGLGEMRSRGRGKREGCPCEYSDEGDVLETGEFLSTYAYVIYSLI